MNKDKNGLLEGFAEFSRKVAAEGCVLLRNNDTVLPLTKEDNIAIFGRMQIDSYRSGTGSGGSVNIPYKVDILEGLQNKGVNINQKIVESYTRWIKDNPFDNGGGGWAAEPWHQKEMSLSTNLVKEACQTSNKAIIIIGRTAGEDQDNLNVEGSYLLTSQEKDMIKIVTQYFNQVVILLNVSNIIDTSWIDDETYSDSIKGVIYVWQGGMEGGNGVADVLVGDVSPSGKLTDTIAYSIEDYPSTRNYGDDYRNYYEEDIYVGYRYFETFCPEKVQFPFGYGLSYTTFEMSCQALSIKDDVVRLKVAVKNIGKLYSGKEVIQIYVEAPQGNLGKPSKQLIAFTKTNVLKPGEEEEIAVEIPLISLASYDDSGITGFPYCYVLEPGQYKLYLGNSSRNLEKLMIGIQDGYEVEELRVLKKLQQALAPRETFKRIRPGQKKLNGVYDIVYEEVPKQIVALKERMQKNLPRTMVQTGDLGYKLKDVYKNKISINQFIGQLSNEDLAAIVRGEGMSSPWVTDGTASAFGGVTQRLREFGIPIACTADGPSGIRMEGGGYATQLPIGTLLAATWNTELIEGLYEMEGKELLLNRVDTLLGPGLNIRRNPLNGRNFEYFSEDPLISGKFTAAIVRGIAKSGVHATSKHFACNNQEKSRTFVDAILSERALREIYLKGFEIAVKEGHAQSIMTAYNPINGYWSASNYDLNTTILRNEWGFEGIVMTDWWAKMNHVVDGGEATIHNTDSMIRSQNDLYMVVPNYGAEFNSHRDNTLESLASGELTVGELQYCASNICRFLMKVPAFFRTESTVSTIKQIKNINYNLNEVEAAKVEAGIVYPKYDETTYVKIEAAGVYSIRVTFESPDGELNQVACNLIINDKVANIIQTQGTNGESMTHIIGLIELQEGIYKINLQKLKPELMVSSVEFLLKN